MKRIIISVVFLATALISAVQGRTWTDNKGHKITADYVSLLQLEEPKVKLQTSSGKYILVPVRNLSQEDQDYIQELNGKKPVSTDPSNSPIPHQPTQNVFESSIYSAVRNMNIDSREAYEALIQLRESNPSRIEPDYTIALLFLFKKKDYLHAQQHLMRCLKINPNDAGVLINLGTVCILQGKFPEAYSYYQKVEMMGGANYTLNHNLQKLIKESTSHNFFLPEGARKKIVELSDKVSRKVKTSYNSRRGWMFERCSEGLAQESIKCHWFQIRGYRPYEFPICPKCNSSGKIDCPNKNCSGGRVAYYVNKTHRFPNGDTATMPTRQYTACNVCGGKNHLTCPLCNGTGLEFTLSQSEIDNFDREERMLLAEIETRGQQERMRIEAEAQRARQAQLELEAKERQARLEQEAKARREREARLEQEAKARRERQARLEQEAKARQERQARLEQEARERALKEEKERLHNSLVESQAGKTQNHLAVQVQDLQTRQKIDAQNRQFYGVDDQNAQQTRKKYDETILPDQNEQQTRKKYDETILPDQNAQQIRKKYDERILPDQNEQRTQTQYRDDGKESLTPKKYDESITEVTPPQNVTPPKKRIAYNRKRSREVDYFIISVESIEIAPVQLQNSFSEEFSVSDRKYLVLKVQIINNHPTKSFEFRTWTVNNSEDNSPALLKDESNNMYKPAQFGAGKSILFNLPKQSIPPGKSATDTLVFEVPNPKAKNFTLIFPGDNFGDTGLRFVIPFDASEIKK